MNTIRMFKNTLLLIIVLSVVSAYTVQRSETTGDFVSVDYQRKVQTNMALPVPEARKDIPELYNREYLFTDQAPQDSVMKEINGFRLQIFRTEDIIEAKRRESIYIDTFGEENVVLIFEKPFYRIRVGRFRDKEEADEFQQSLSRMGIRDAIIVPDKVNVLMPAKNN